MEESEASQQPLGTQPQPTAVVTRRNRRAQVLIVSASATLVLILLATSFLLGVDFGKEQTTQTQQTTLPKSGPTEPAAEYNQKKDGIVKDFENYKAYGGKTRLATKQIRYTVFLPEAFGFKAGQDRVQLSFANTGPQEQIAADSGEGGGSTCKPTDGGTSCVLTWKLDEQSIPTGEVSLRFKVLDSTTHQKGRVFVPITPGVYAEGGSTIFIDKPTTTPYANFEQTQELVEFKDKAAVADMSVDVLINSQYGVDHVEMSLDGNKVSSADKPIIKDNTSYEGGKVAVYSLTLKKADILALTQGNHSLTAVVKGADFEVPVVTVLGDKQQINLIVFW